MLSVKGRNRIVTKITETFSDVGFVFLESFSYELRRIVVVWIVDTVAPFLLYCHLMLPKDR